MKEERLAFIASSHYVVSLIEINDVLSLLALSVSIISGCLAIRKHFKK